MEARAVPIERRRADRRAAPALFSRYTILGGRRRAPRRAADAKGMIVDVHGPVLFLIVTSVAALNVLDAFFTMLFLSHGAIEVNPVVDWILVHGGVWPFLVVKSLGIGLCVGFLTLTKNFLVSRIGLAVVLLGYSALLGWHLTLLAALPEGALV